MRDRSSQGLDAPTRDPRILQRFWSHVDKDEADDGCWDWRGRCSPAGYPSFQVGQRCIAPS